MRNRHTLAFLATTLLIGSAHAQCTVDLGPDTVTTYFGYTPSACVTLQPALSGPAPYSFVWSNGATAASITVCDSIPGWYFVEVTDGDTCTAGDSVYVNAVDVRCGNNNDKVLVCHIPPGNPSNAHTICISANGVPAHLAHGCVLGSCAPDTVQVLGGSLQMAVSPNPMADATQITVTSTADQQIDLCLYDAGGRILMQVYQGAIAAGETRTFPLTGKAVGATSHMVWMHLRGTSGDRVQRAVMMER